MIAEPLPSSDDSFHIMSFGPLVAVQGGHIVGRREASAAVEGLRGEGEHLGQFSFTLSHGCLVRNQTQVKRHTPFPLGYDPRSSRPRCIWFLPGTSLYATGRDTSFQLYQFLTLPLCPLPSHAEAQVRVKGLCLGCSFARAGDGELVHLGCLLERTVAKLM